MIGPLVDPTDPIQFASAFQRYYERWITRNNRMDRIDRIVRGEWTVSAEDGEDIPPASPNLIQTALEDTAEAASLVPSVRVTASRPSDPAKKKAAKMEQLGASYLDVSEIPLLAVRSMLDLAGLGMFSWVVTYDRDLGPRIERRDPRECYPEPNVSTLGVTERCFFARDMYLTQLHDEWQQRFLEHCLDKQINPRYWVDHTVTLVEYYDRDLTVIAAVYDGNKVNSPFGLARTRDPGAVSVILEVVENKTGLCPVIVGQRMSLDNEPRGQFDQVIGILEAHIRLLALVLDYSDQQVYSEMWVKGLIGDMPTGGGGYIQLTEGGGVGRVPPAVSSLSVYNELQQLIDNIHLGGRWPKTRPGEVDQAIASAKFVEATVGMMNTVIRTYHLIMRRALEQSLRVAFKVDKTMGHERSVSGVLRNQQFNLERDVKDIDLSARIRVEYGLGLGRDPAQSMVLGIQAKDSGIVSLDFVRENFEGITDVEMEKVRNDLQQLQDMMFAKLLQATQDGSGPPGLLSEIYKARQNGEAIADLYEKHFVKPMEEMAAQMVPTGMGPPMAPGPDPTAMGAPQVPPGPEDPLAALLGGGGGMGPPEPIARTSVPLGNGSFAGVQSGG